MALTSKNRGYCKALPSRRVQFLAGAMVLIGIVLVFFLGGGGGSHPATEHAPSPRHPAAVDHVPGFIASANSPDVLLGVMAVVLVGAVLATGVVFFWLHSLPERLVHKSTKMHLDIVAMLALLSLFTHVHIFWVAALLIAMVRIPDFSFLTRHLQRMTVSLERIADAQPTEGEGSPADPRQPPPRENERKPC